jgi:excisionase family DNA binding protein
MVAMVDDEVLTADEAAVLLKVSVQTVLKESREGRLPGIKIGREWRYSRIALMRHLGQYVGESDAGGGAKVDDQGHHPTTRPTRSG